MLKKIVEREIYSIYLSEILISYIVFETVFNDISINV